jgi:uncharacterized membrane protein
MGTSAAAEGGRAPRTAPSGRLLAGTLLLGLGLGGFVDGIVLHQILQWHHMLTGAGYPATTVGNLELNTVADGLFHGATWIFTVAGVAAGGRGRGRVGGLQPGGRGDRPPAAGPPPR